MQLAPTGLPIHLIPKTFLMDVPPSAYRSKSLRQRETKGSSGSNAKFFADFFSPRKAALRKQGDTETLRFKVGGWVNLPVGFRQPISLLLIYHDIHGEQAILIDEMDARGASEVLLSGEVEITGSGIDSMSLYCGGICDKAVWAENLSINRIQAETSVSKASKRMAS